MYYQKKIESLHKELPLLSTVFTENIKSVFSEFVNEKAGTPHFLKREGSDYENHTQYSKSRMVATEFSNVSLGNNGIGETKMREREGLEGSKRSYTKQNITEITEFSNGEARRATEYSNFIEKKRRERDLNLWLMDGGS
jgi:hypothetical protein